jgi:hypothetical protein
MTHARELRRLQAEFARAILHGDVPDFAARIAGDAGRALRQLAIYRRAVLANLQGALRAAYPVVARIVGDAFFDEAARCHAEASPSASGDLNCFGGAFPAFLAAYPHAGPMPWLSDVARLEWAWHESLLAADAEGLDPAALARVPVERQPGIRFTLHPAVRLVRSAWPVLSLWEANQPGRDGTPEREEGADEVLVWREEGRVRLALLSPPESAFVEAILRGRTVEEACGAADWDLPALLRRLSEQRVLCGFSA